MIAPFVWENDNLPLPPPSNAPTLLAIAASENVAVAIFSNAPGELQHGLHLSTNLTSGWIEFGHRAVLNTAGVWQVFVKNATATEMYRAFAGPAVPYQGVLWSPNPLPETGGVLRVEFCQHSRALAGDRYVQIAGIFNGWTP